MFGYHKMNGAEWSETERNGASGTNETHSIV